MSTLLVVESKRHLLIDAALVAGCLLLTAFAVKGHWSEPSRPVIAAAGVLGSAGQLWRRKFPALAALAGAVTYPLSGNPAPLVLGLYSAGSYAKRVLALLLAGAGWAGFAGWSWLGEGRADAQDLTSSALAAAACTAAGIYGATRRDLQESLRLRAEQAESERGLRDLQARAAERARIAREMHDVLAHKVSLIAVHAGALELSAGTDRDRQGAALIRVTAREALGELRTVLSVLREEPAPFADLGALVEEAGQAGQQVELDDRAGPLPPGTARTVYRVAQEGLTNARKHAPGAPVTVTVTVDREEDTVTVTVRNARAAGAALDLPGAGAGLIGLAERLRLLGGSLHAGSLTSGSLTSGPLTTGGVDDGWQLRAVVPGDGPA